jgi:hypothetical protein
MLGLSDSSEVHDIRNCPEKAANSGLARTKRSRSVLPGRKSLGSWQSPHIVLPTLPIGTFGHTRHNFGSK